eukprot:106746-Pyramimonas_sp.AAC.1
MSTTQTSTESNRTFTRDAPGLMQDGASGQSSKERKSGGTVLPHAIRNARRRPTSLSTLRRPRSRAGIGR